MENVKLIFFDVETNGFKGSSVLSISAMRIVYNINSQELIKTGEYNRFYFRREGEPISQGAIDVNGLNDEEIERRRSLSEEIYPMTFDEDIDSFIEFCSGAKHYIAHNIRFDRDFLPFVLENQFDTMLENQYVVNIEDEYGRVKWPKLMECAKYYNIKLDEDRLHESMYDVIIMARVFYCMFKKSATQKRILDFILNERK